MLSYTTPKMDASLINLLRSLQIQLTGRSFSTQEDTEDACRLNVISGRLCKRLLARDANREVEYYKNLYEEALARVSKE